jgi:UDP-N-acetylmuramate--alanine ligase
MGISGVGMSALAHCMLDLNMKVSGSDKQSSKYSLELEQRGVCIDYTQSGKFLQKGLFVVASSAIAEENPEILEAKRLELDIYSRDKLLAELSQDRVCISITGAHGKSTTSCLLAYTLKNLGLQPSYILGASTPGLERHARIGRGQILVCEADESDNSNLSLDTDFGVVLNFDCDHLNYHKNCDRLKESYQRFIQKSKRGVIYCSDDSFLNNLGIAGLSYGLSSDCDVQGYNLDLQTELLSFSCCIGNCRYENIQLGLMGKHNVLNALAVLAICSKLGITLDRVVKSFRSFKGVARRLEKRSEHFNALFYDDYAHHPNEIRATLKALKSRYSDKNITAIFEPHSLYRFKHCFDEFCTIFRDQKCVITDLFDIEPCPVDLRDEFIKRVGNECMYVARAQIKEFMQGFKDSDQLVVTLGAGSLTGVHDEF